MSEKVARLAVQLLRNKMFPALPQSYQDMFAKITDPLVSATDKVPNIVVGDVQDFGANVAFPIITVHGEGITDNMVNVYRHLDMIVDIWAGDSQSSDVDGRRIVSTLYEFVRRSLQNVNWSGLPPGGTTPADFVQVERSYETERSPILFQADQKLYHIRNSYRVEVLSQTWY